MGCCGYFLPEVKLTQTVRRTGHMGGVFRGRVPFPTVALGGGTMNVSARQSLNRFAPVRSVVSMHTKLSPHHKRVLSALGTLSLGVMFGLGATALGAAGVVTKFDTFCAT